MGYYSAELGVGLEEWDCMVAVWWWGAVMVEVGHVGSGDGGGIKRCRAFWSAVGVGRRWNLAVTIISYLPL